MNAQLKINGLVVDADKIGAGLYSVICAKGEEAIVAFGMIPKWVIDCFEKQLREKIIAEAAKQNHATPAELAPYVSDELIQDTMRPIVHAVTCAIYRAASEKGAMLV